MKITPYNILRHEIIGLEVEVVKSTHPGHLKVKGVIVDETMNLILVKTALGIKAVPKKTSIFRIKLPEGLKVDVEGQAILARPEDRVRRRLKRKDW